MGESLSSKLTTLQSCCHAPGSIAYCRIYLFRVPEGATTDGEEQSSTGAGEKMEEVE